MAGPLTRALVKVPRFHHEPAEQRREIDEAPRDHVQHVAFALQLTAHLEQPRFEQRRTLLIGYPFPDDHIHEARLILQRHESHAAGAAGALSRDDEPGRGDPTAGGEGPKRLGIDHPALLEPVAHERQGVAPEREPEARVVGDDVMALARRAQQRDALRAAR